MNPKEGVELFDDGQHGEVQIPLKQRKAGRSLHQSGLPHGIQSIQPIISEKEHHMRGLDFETYGERNLPVVGLDNYLSDPRFRSLVAAIVYRHNGAIVKQSFDFVNDFGAARAFRNAIYRQELIAHNASFERGVLRATMLGHVSPIYDSAVIARCMGADSHLEKAAPQLLDNVVKMEVGKRLIRKFSIPREDGTSLVEEMAAAGTLATDPDWLLFMEYCEQDALASLLIGEEYLSFIPTKEWRYEALTQSMNDEGWRVDLVAVEEMQRRYLENQAAALAAFRVQLDPKGELNFNSTPQLIKWCKERGIKAVSFDEAHVEKLYTKLYTKLVGMDSGDPKYEKYMQVQQMLYTKKTIGGSSLTKLQKILNLVGEDSILRNQYMHVGAGQSYRTSGRGVQMQNLKRLSEIADMDELSEDTSGDWDNAKLAENVRQVFTARNPKGALIVGDFKSVESRGLAFIAGAHWKTKAFREEKDMYKVLAEQIYHVKYEDVTKEQRQAGKVGELSCGYGAGSGAVQAFAEKMGVVMSEDDASKLVKDWRSVNPEVVQLWSELDRLLHEGLSTGSAYLRTVEGLNILVHTINTPASLKTQHPGAKSLELQVLLPGGEHYLNRVFQGCYVRGRNVCYYKPSSNQGGALWSAFFMDPKTKQRRFYDIYGGKLAGILTQSFCRELFFSSMENVHQWTSRMPGLTLIGQFHDELVVDYDPDLCSLALDEVKDIFEIKMSGTGQVSSSFPLAADIKSGYRYIK